MDDIAPIRRTRLILALNALKIPCGGMHHGELSVYSGLKSGSRRDRNLIDDRP